MSSEEGRHGCWPWKVQEITSSYGWGLGSGGGKSWSPKVERGGWTRACNTVPVTGRCVKEDGLVRERQAPGGKGRGPLLLEVTADLFRGQQSGCTVKDGLQQRRSVPTKQVSTGAR